MSNDQRIDGYARGLFEVAKAEGTLDEVEDELFRFARSYESSEELRTALSDDLIPPAKRQAIGHRLMDHRAITGTNGFRLRPPCCDAGGVLRVGGQPRLDGLAAVRRQLAVDIDVQLVFGHGCVAVDHDMTFLAI